MTRRVRRWRGTGPLGSALLMVCFVVLALSIVQWVRSYWASDAWSYREARATDEGRVDVLLLDVWSGQGSLVFTRQSWQYNSHGDRSGRRIRWARHPAASAAEGLAAFKLVMLPLGFGSARDTTSAAQLTAVVVPCWAVVLLLSLPTAWLAWRAYRQWRRRLLGLCDQCGYDLRASAGTCPECGAEIPAALPRQQADTSAATPS